MTREAVAEAAAALDRVPPEEVLRWAGSTFGRLAVASSLGAEDQVLTDIALRVDPSIRIFTLDTGRLFPETYDLMQRTAAKYGFSFDVRFPDSADVEPMVREHGPNLFYEGVELRKRCCFVRKVKPLRRALAGLDAWICGLRRGQSVTRTDLAPVEWDEQNDLVKINPLVDWSEEEVWSYIRDHDVPYNELHDRGFPSIGCQPCTRAVAPGEDPRSGRWWWESPEHKECGLHGKREEERPARVVVRPVNLS